MDLRLAFILFFVTYAQCSSIPFEKSQQSGCKIIGDHCSCGFGSKTDFIYKTRSDCLNAVRERSLNMCARMPCLRGTCIQTVQNPRFTCKCEGTGFYGQICERACPKELQQSRGMVFQHECIVI